MQEHASASPVPYRHMAAFYDVMEPWVCRAWHESTRPQMADFLQSTWKAHGTPVHDVLDLCCGTGLLLRELTQRGYTVTGYDRSAAMLEQAAEKVESPEPARLVRGELPDIPLRSEFDAVTCTGAALNYLPNETALLRSFESVLGVLRSGGTFTFDLYTDRLLERYVEFTAAGARAFEGENGHTFLLSCQRPHSKDSFDFSYVHYVRDDATQTYVRNSETHRVFTQSQEKIHSLVARAGFAGVQVFDNYQRQPTSPQTLYETYVMVKP